MKLNKHEWIGLGGALGAVIGAVAGSATHQMGAWLPIGTGIGIAVANAIASRSCEKPDPNRRFSAVKR